MRKWSMFMIVAFCLLVTAVVWAQEDIKKYPSCKYCGMDREQFAHSRMLVEYDDGTAEGTCSLHCMAVELGIRIDKTPKTIFIGDFIDKKLIDAEKGFWIIGGNKMGVMTKRAKWAFAKQEDAEQFKKENGGDALSFEQAIKAAYEDMYADTKMIRERRKMKKMQQKMEHK